MTTGSEEGAVGLVGEVEVGPELELETEWRW